MGSEMCIRDSLLLDRCRLVVGAGEVVDADGDVRRSRLLPDTSTRRRGSGARIRPYSRNKLPLHSVELPIVSLKVKMKLIMLNLLCQLHVPLEVAGVRLPVLCVVVGHVEVLLPLLLDLLLQRQLLVVLPDEAHVPHQVAVPGSLLLLLPDGLGGLPACLAQCLGREGGLSELYRHPGCFFVFNFLMITLARFGLINSCFRIENAFQLLLWRRVECLKSGGMLSALASAEVLNTLLALIATAVGPSILSFAMDVVLEEVAFTTFSILTCASAFGWLLVLVVSFFWWALGLLAEVVPEGLVKLEVMGGVE